MSKEHQNVSGGLFTIGDAVPPLDFSRPGAPLPDLGRALDPGLFPVVMDADELLEAGRVVEVELPWPELRGWMDSAAADAESWGAPNSLRYLSWHHTDLNKVISG